MLHLQPYLVKRVVLLVAFNSWFVIISCAQDIPSLLLSDQQLLTRLSKTLLDNNKAEMFKKCVQVSKSLGIFSKKIKKSATVPPGYMAALKNYHALLEVANKKLDTGYIIEVLQFLSIDVNLKNGSGLGVSEKVSNAVLVKVKVVNVDGKEQSGYRVFNRYFLAGDDSVFDELNPTNHAEKNILPGWYLFWIADSEGKVAERSTHITANENNIITFLIH